MLKNCFLFLLVLVSFYQAAGQTIKTLDLPKNSYCLGDEVVVEFTTTGTFNTTNTFKGQISDESGSFASASDLEFVGVVSPTSIRVKLISRTLAIANYKIRVVSSDPVIEGSATSEVLLNFPPYAPQKLIGELVVCEGSKNNSYSIPSPAAGNHYKWKVSPDVTISSSNADSNVVTLDFTTAGTALLSVSEVSSCAISSPYEKTITVKTGTLASIKISGNNSLCNGSSGTFKAEILNGGTSPEIKWYVSKQVQSETSATFVSSTLTDVDTVWATVSSSEGCSSAPSISNKLKIDIQGLAPPTIQLIVDSALNLNTKLNYEYNDLILCKGDALHFKTVAFGAGPNPRYKWWIEDVDIITTNQSTFSTSVLKNKQRVIVQLGHKNCADGTLIWTWSNWSETVTIRDTLRPSLELTFDNLHCSGKAVTLSSHATIPGKTPLYTWLYDGQKKETTDSVLVIDGLDVGEYPISLTMKSSDNCARPQHLTVLDTITILKSETLSPVITGDTKFCEGSLAQFKLTSPDTAKGRHFEWMVNDKMVKKDTSLYSSTKLTNGNTVAVKVTSDRMCDSHKEIQSNTLTMDIAASPTPEIVVNASPTAVCPGEKVTYSANITNSGTNSIYSWLVNDSVQKNEVSDKFVHTMSGADDVKFNYSTLLSCGPFVAKMSSVPVVLNEGVPVLTSIIAPPDICSLNKEIVFTTDAFSNTVYTWAYPASATGTSDGNSLRITLGNTNSTDTLSVFASNSCGTGSPVKYGFNPQNCIDLFVPTAIITSSEDGNNMWSIRPLELYPLAVVKVFNRWGALVFKSQGTYVPWNGFFQDKPLPAGTYYYLIEGVKEKPLMGAVTIIN